MDENNRVCNGTNVQIGDTILELNKSTEEEVGRFKITKVVKSNCIGISLIDEVTKKFQNTVSFNMNYPRDFTEVSEVFHRVYR